MPPLFDRRAARSTTMTLPPPLVERFVTTHFSVSLSAIGSPGAMPAHPLLCRYAKPIVIVDKHHMGV